MSPLDGAANGMRRGFRRFAVSKNSLQRLSKISAPHSVGTLPVVVDPSRIAQSAMAVKEEQVRGMRGAIDLRNLLGRVPQIRKVVALDLGALHHILEAVLRVVHVIVRVDGHELHSPVSVIPLDLNQAIFIGLHIGAVIAREQDDKHWHLCKTLQVVGLPIHAKAGKLGR